MAEPLKNLYNTAFFDALGKVMKEVIPSFDKKAFLRQVYVNAWDGFELKQRTDHVAKTVHLFFEKDFRKGVKQLLALIDAYKKQKVHAGFEHIFTAHYIELYGQDHPELSLNAIEKITQFISCEFAIRPFIVKYPQQTMQQMLAWSKHKSEHVRRLASEGCRPRLPWAMALPGFKKDPSPILPILENLKTDESEYVRKSVANNLNDIAKDNPRLVISIAKKWKGDNKNTNWIIKHGSRTLLKKADGNSLALFGFSHKTITEVTDLRIDKKQLKKGETLGFAFNLVNREKKPAKLRIEFAVHYMKANGKQNRKLFKITENTYAAGKVNRFDKKHSFKDLTTRKHYPGKHALSIVINGQTRASVDFILR